MLHGEQTYRRGRSERLKHGIDPFWVGLNSSCLLRQTAVLKLLLASAKLLLVVDYSRLGTVKGTVEGTIFLKLIEK